MPGDVPSCVVVGGGPAGLFAAETLVRAGHRVAVYDAQATMGRKFLMAGRGGLNLTHSESLEPFLDRYGATRSWLEPMIRFFPPDDLRAWAHDLGIETYIGSSGRVFPLAHKASPLLRAWLRRLVDLGVVFYPRHRWVGFGPPGTPDDMAAFIDPTGSQILVHAPALILALGGGSWPHLGADGAWVDILRAQGVAITPFRAANCGYQVAWPDVFATRWAGTPLKTVAVTIDGETVQGEGVITAQGVEGGVFYALSPRLGPILAERSMARITLDLKPGLSFNAVVDRLSTPRRGASHANFLRKTLNLPPVALGLLRYAAPDLPTDPHHLAGLIKAVAIPLTGLAPLSRAISSAGGIARGALDDALMLRARPGVYAIGEMLDWEAPTGGYLLQACFAMGNWVGMRVKKNGHTE